MSKKNIKGSLHPWKDYSQVELLLDQEVLTCEKCGNQIMTVQDLRNLDENIAQSLLLKINNAITYLTTKYKVTQEDLAIALGRTPEYISMIKNGKKKPSFGTFNLLMSYQLNPQMLTSLAGVKIVEPVQLWEGPRLLKVYVGGALPIRRWRTLVWQNSILKCIVGNGVRLSRSELALRMLRSARIQFIIQSAD
ncbi:hypothetical protein [Bdellovibrio bacteriovorus]|uniref:hypothetical protein n=1 Tax=Bdellovibrio bacteriovorus TaxID=959 RepID=UPI0011D1DB38|nr:hypothetical protein [Bdellovibrio bacteriovorus]